MKAIIGCEESQAVTIAFRNLGYEAYSCDILPCSGGHPEWHIQADIIEVLTYGHNGLFDLAISFPPCTDLSVSGARWFEKKRLSGEQESSINFFLDVWELSDSVENPVNIMTGHKYIKKWFPEIYERILDIKFPMSPSDVIQPWQFGHGETKKTLLWRRRALSAIPLRPTKIVEGREQRIWKLPPTADRGMLRSKTYTGIAQAMAEQWGSILSTNVMNLHNTTK